MQELHKASNKRASISKAGTTMAIVLSLTSFIIILGIYSAHQLLSKISYQNRVIVADKRADSVLQHDVVSANSLINSYTKFVNQTPNIIGGNPSINGGGNNGNNATIILDALPSSYDFPALVTSINSLLASENLSVTSIGGTDNIANIDESPTTDPQPIQIPFSFTVSNANYSTIQDLFKKMELSIRPLSIDSINITGSDTSLTVSVNAHTYFQQPKKFTIGQETIQ